MADGDSGDIQPIIIKKVQGDGGGSHGGAWKLAYADFVTAMMAFFLLMWLLNVTTEEQKSGIADYFSPSSVSRSSSGADGILAGRSLDVAGAKISVNTPTAQVEISPPPDTFRTPTDQETPQENPTDPSSQVVENVSPAEAALRAQEKREREQEDKEFEEAQQTIKQALEENPDLKELAENLKIDVTDDGLRIQIVDQHGKAMFPPGSADMPESTKDLMQQIAKVVNGMDNKVSITGHTDATPFVSSSGYDNFELSSDRANSSRRALVQSGVDSNRIVEVTGRAAQELLLPDKPKDPQNRRISIIMLRKSKTDRNSGGANGEGSSPLPPGFGEQ